MTPGATPSCTYIFTYIACTSLTLLAQPTAHPRQLLAPQDLGVPLPPRSPSLPPHTQPHIPKAPCIPTGEYGTPQCAIRLTTQQPCPGPASPHNDPGSDPSMHVCMHIYCICFADACSPTHSPRTTAIGFAGPRTPSSSSPPSSLPPHTQAHIPEVLCIPRGKYHIIHHVVQRPIAYNATASPRLHQTS